MRSGVFILAGLAVLMACTPEISQRGYLPDPSLEAQIKNGDDTKSSVQDKLGYASTTATFGNDTWYYISSTEKQVAFFTPTVQHRTILAIAFDKQNKVTSMRHYTLQDGHVVALESRVTPTRGRELTFLQQLLYATPQQSNKSITDQAPGGGGLP